MRRAGALLPAVVAGLAGLCSALLLLGDTRQRTVLMASAAPDARQVAAGITRERRGAEGGRRRPKATCKEYARFVWREERLEKEGVKVDTWLDPGLLDSIDFRDRPYTAGHHPADGNITNNTTPWTPLHRPVRIARCALVHRFVSHRPKFQDKLFVTAFFNGAGEVVYRVRAAMRARLRRSPRQ